jgi:hypothetical protein
LLSAGLRSSANGCCAVVSIDLTRAAQAACEAGDNASPTSPQYPQHAAPPVTRGAGQNHYISLQTHPIAYSQKQFTRLRMAGVDLGQAGIDMFA